MFLNEENINIKQVGVTCERCSITDCEVRFCEATELLKKAKNEAISNIVKQIFKDYS